MYQWDESVAGMLVPPLKKKKSVCLLSHCSSPDEVVILRENMPPSLLERDTFYLPNLALKLPSIIYGFVTRVFFTCLSVYLFCVKFALAVGLARGYRKL